MPLPGAGPERQKSTAGDRSCLEPPAAGGNAASRALFHLRVDRATRWGNPYPIGKRYGDRVQVVERYRQDLWRRIRSGEVPLEGLAAHRPLACWCFPRRPCHAEILARAAVWAAAELGHDGHDVSSDS
ncbi:MAG: DUF4326 domain-containing protein [Rhodospirillaceae bacterium]|nr:DUF4326 domain-containing protein [Rhodospirillaceae bacterium]